MVIIFCFNTVQSGNAPKQSNSATCDYPLFYCCSGSIQSISNTIFFLSHLHFAVTTDLLTSFILNSSMAYTRNFFRKILVYASSKNSYGVDLCHVLMTGNYKLYVRIDMENPTFNTATPLHSLASLSFILSFSYSEDVFSISSCS